MDTRDYEIDGKETGALKGQTVRFRVAQTLQEAVSLGKSEADAQELIQSAFDVWAQGRVRSMAKAGKSLEEIQAWLDSASYERRQATAGGAKPKSSGKVKEAQAKASKFDAILARAASDEKYRRQGVKLEMFTDSDVDEYIARQVTAPTSAEPVTA